MAANKRTQNERERDLDRLAGLYCKGRSQLSIAEELGVSRTQVIYDLKLLYKRWQESALCKLEERKAAELARIDHLEAVAWTAWERSTQDAQTSFSKIVQGRTGKDGSALPELKTVSKTTEGQAGDPRFLERVSWCIDKRCEILGINAPKKLSLGGKIDLGPDFTPRILADPHAAELASDLLERLGISQSDASRFGLESKRPPLGSGPASGFGQPEAN